MGELPTGTVTFLFTDIEGSTRLLQHLGDDIYDRLLGEHHRILRDAIAAHDGVEISTEGDAFFVVFARAADAVAMTLDAQTALGCHEWPESGAVRVRMGLHTGLGRLGGDSYVGLAVHQAARISSSAHGGQVVSSQATRDAAGVLAGVAWQGLGHHRLKDLGGPVELFQLCHPDLIPEFPPLRSLERVSHNLPVQLSSFLGRGEELALGAKLLASTRLLSITGPGGTGKTRLAYQIAADELQQYPDGVWVTELASVSNPALVPAALLAAVGLRDEPGRTATETIVSHLRNRKALVVLDNCEHLIAAAAALAAELLRGCPELRILSTSREPLRVTGESVWALGPLTLPAAGAVPLEVLATTDAVALFCERAAEATVGFTLSAGNASAVEAICRLLEGIPLALELAAARVRTLPLPLLIERLGHSLDLLSKGVRGAADRQASLRGTIAWSHDLLSDTERSLFRRLSVFAGGFTLEAAEGVGAGDALEGVEVLDTLDSLVDKSLVALGEERAGEGRYRLLETIRTYAAERVEEAGEQTVLAERHATYFAQLAHDCAGQGESVKALDRLEADHPNLLAALDHLASCDEPIGHGQLAADLSSFWDLRGHWRLARRELLRYLARGSGDRALEAQCAHGLGTVAFNLGDYPEARVRLETALGVAREVGDPRLEGRCYRDLGRVSTRLGDHIEARASYEHALSIAREVGDRRFEGHCVGDLGIVASFLGDYPEAGARYEVALGIARDVGDRRFEGTWVGDLGFVEFNLGNYTEARARFEDALGIAREVGDRRFEGWWIGGLGNVAASLGDYSGARARFEEALGIARELGTAAERACGSETSLPTPQPWGTTPRRVPDMRRL